MAPQVFENITVGRYESLKGIAAKAGLHIEGDSGKAALPTPVGTLKFDYHYDNAAQKLTIHCTDKPWIVPESKVRNTINDIVTATA